jgi:hypothetical protein
MQKPETHWHSDSSYQPVSDVLYGKGKTIQEHCGSMRCLAALVDERLPRYEKLGKQEKTALANDIIVQMVKKSSGRFLSQESGVWMEVHRDFARNKGAHTFCNRRNFSRKESSSQLSLVKPKYTRRTESRDASTLESSGNNRAKYI